MSYVDPVEKQIWCPKRQYWHPLLSCLRCAGYPCAAMDEERRQTLAASPFVTIDPDRSFLMQTRRRERMYVLKYNDGRLVEADETFDPENLEWKMMEDVAEVLFVSKIFVPQIRLVAKPAEERARIRRAREDEEQTGADAAPEAAEAAPEAEPAQPAPEEEEQDTDILPDVEPEPARRPRRRKAS